MNHKPVVLLLFATYAAFGQDRAIEVASIKLVEFPSQAFFEGFTFASAACGYMRPTVSGNRVTLPTTSLCGLIRQAYQLQDYRIVGIPDALMERVQTNYFTTIIQAEEETALAPDDVQSLLARLLEERFQLKFHWEMKELPALALRVAKNGPKMPTKDLENCDTQATTLSGGVRGRAILNCKANTTIAQLAASLTRETDRPVIDRTGLSGKYVVQLRWSPNDDGNAPSLFTAVQEQLGLKLEAEKLQWKF